MTYVHISELALVPKPFDHNCVFFEWLKHIAAISNISCPLFLLAPLISFRQNLFSRNNILLKHFTEENVIDFNIMCWKSVVQKTRWEHHVVSIEPKFCSVLGVKHILVSWFGKSSSCQNKHGCCAINEQTRIIKRPTHVSKETRSNRPHGSINTEDLHPHVVDNSKSSVESVSAVFSLSHFNSLKHPSNRPRSWGEAIIYQVLKAACVFEQPRLNFLRHCYLLMKK